MSHVLLSVTGMSPAVITETLFAIQQNELPWPDRLVVMTTTVGAAKLAGLQENIDLLCAEYGCPSLAVDQIEIAVITDAKGVLVSDARSVEDHEALGDFIMQKVRDISSEPNSTIHASIAGGRKTMTFYLGYAMSLFGRPGDRLSHVLISEPFEQVPTFRFPRAVASELQTYQGEWVDAASAKVTLADIPFICLRDELSPAMLEMGGNVSFREMVKLINLGDRESVQPQLHVVLSSSACELRLFDDNKNLIYCLTLSTLDFAFYRTVIELSLEPQMAAVRPLRGEKDTDLAVALAETLLQMAGVDGNDQPLTQLLAQLYDLDQVLQISPRTLDTLGAGGINTHFFDTRCSAIRDAITQVLPPKMARWLVLRHVTDDANTRLDFYAKHWPNIMRGGGYGIALTSQHIHLH